jgi:hypothetical protein
MTLNVVLEHDVQGLFDVHIRMTLLLVFCVSANGYETCRGK